MTTAGAVVAAAGLLVASVGASAGTAIYVNPAVSTSGDGTQTKPFKKIQDALNKAQPGDTVNLMPGVYREQPKTVRNGSASAPITIKGTETGKNKATRYNTVLFGTGRIFNVDHSYITIQGFTIDGQEKLRNTTYPTSIGAMNAFKDANQANIVDSKLIYIGSADTSRDITGVTIDDMLLSGAGTECVRMRNNANGNTVMNSVVQYCGMFAKTGTTSDRYHNGEAIYVGTSPKSTTQPMYANDTSSNNSVVNSTIRPYASECFNVKENAHDNVFDGNFCAGNVEADSGSNIELRGYNNIVRNSTVTESANWNIKIQSDSAQYDKGGNQIVKNTLTGYATAPIQIKSVSKQGLICGNQPAVAIVAGVDASAQCPSDTPVTTTTAAPATTQAPTATKAPTTTTTKPPATTTTVAPTTTTTRPPTTTTTQAPTTTTTTLPSGPVVQLASKVPSVSGNTKSTYSFRVSRSGNYKITGTVRALPTTSRAAYVSLTGPQSRNWSVTNISSSTKTFATSSVYLPAGRYTVTTTYEKNRVQFKSIGPAAG